MTTASIIKPGYHVPQNDKDNSYFGGLFEIFGLRRDLELLGIDIVEKECADVEFVFGSEAQKVSKPRVTTRSKIVPCVTDLNLAEKAIWNNRSSLNQIPNTKSYYPFQSYVIDFLRPERPDFQEWSGRRYRMIYGGGSRNGMRRKNHMKYLYNNDNFARVFSSALELSPLPNTSSKISHTELLKYYQSARFGLVFGESSYEKLGMVTQRPYDYMVSGMIPIFDYKYNSEAVLGREALWVSNREELSDLMSEIESNKSLYDQQRDLIDSALRSQFHKGLRRKKLLSILNLVGTNSVD